MSEQEFTQLVYQMRQAQQEYLKRRTLATLQKAKELERRVDAAVLRWANEEGAQPCAPTGRTPAAPTKRG